MGSWSPPNGHIRMRSLMQARITKMKLIVILGIAMAGCIISITTLPLSNKKVVKFSELLNDPYEYNHKTITTEGFIVIELENVAVYESEESAYPFQRSSGIWINLDYESVNQYWDILLKYKELYGERTCVITGAFNAESKGHLGLFIGSIKPISIVPIDNNNHGEK